jgi:hypothetical protein
MDEPERVSCGKHKFFCVRHLKYSIRSRKNCKGYQEKERDIWSIVQQILSFSDMWYDFV